MDIDLRNRLVEGITNRDEKVAKILGEMVKDLSREMNAKRGIVIEALATDIGVSITDIQSFIKHQPKKLHDN